MRITRRVAMAAATAIVAAAVPLLVIPASAATTPPWEPDVQAIGTLTFYNSAGQVVTGGSNLSHLFDYAVASTTDAANGTKATMYFAQPRPGIATGNFAVGQESSSTPFPNAAAPAPINTSTHPVVTLTAADANLTFFIQSQVPPTEAGYVNVYQVRAWTSGPGGVGTGAGHYWDADVMVNPTAGTWTEVYPNQGSTVVSTSTTLSASPSGSAQQGAQVTLTATVAAADSTHPAGTVEFFQGTTDLGPGAVSTTTGIATLTTSAMLPSAPSGPNSAPLTAKFTPTDNSTYSGSTSPSLPYTVNPVATVPTLSGPHQVGATETCTEGSGPLDFGVTASYTWNAGGKTLGNSAQLVIPASALNQALTCTASVQDGSGPASSATSASVKVIPGKAPRDVKKPTLSGPHRVGTTEKVRPGTWSPRAVTFTYQWLLNGKVIKHATKSSLKLTRGDKGKKISCRVTAHEAGHSNGVATTSSVKVS